MTVTAPPWPPERRDPAELQAIEALEALIKEARQRARRRRRRYAAVAALLALTGLWLFTVFGLPEPSQSASAGLPIPAAAAPDPNEASIVAQWAEYHVGWVLVYADGRVIWHPDGAGLWERRLTAAGLELVRSGAVQPSALLTGEGWNSRISLPAALADAWADSRVRPYEPSNYAVCYWRTIFSDSLIDATHVVGRLPAPAQALLRGKERTYNNYFIRDNRGHLAGRQGPLPAAIECSELTTEQTRALGETFHDAGFSGESSQDTSRRSWFEDESGRWVAGFDMRVSLNGPGEPPEVRPGAMPILPHGEWVEWSG